MDSVASTVVQDNFDKSQKKIKNPKGVVDVNSEINSLSLKLSEQKEKLKSIKKEPNSDKKKKPINKEISKLKKEEFAAKSAILFNKLLESNIDSKHIKTEILPIATNVTQGLLQNHPDSIMEVINSAKKLSNLETKSLDENKRFKAQIGFVKDIIPELSNIIKDDQIKNIVAGDLPKYIEKYNGKWSNFANRIPAVKSALDDAGVKDNHKEEVIREGMNITSELAPILYNALHALTDQENKINPVLDSIGTVYYSAKQEKIAHDKHKKHFTHDDDTKRWKERKQKYAKKLMSNTSHILKDEKISSIIAQDLPNFLKINKEQLSSLVKKVDKVSSVINSSLDKLGIEDNQKETAMNDAINIAADSVPIVYKAGISVLEHNNNLFNIIDNAKKLAPARSQKKKRL